MKHPVLPQYRTDIDGLRALAVVPVVMFHLKLPILRGGFVDVDIFFVIISGYLIGSLGRGSADGSVFVARLIKDHGLLP